MLPSDFGLCKPEQNLAMIVAYVETKRTMQSIDDWIQAEEMKKNGK